MSDALAVAAICAVLIACLASCTVLNLNQSQTANDQYRACVDSGGAWDGWWKSCNRKSAT